MTISKTNVSQYAPGFKIEINGSEIEPEVEHSILSLNVEQELNKTNAFTFEVQDEFKAGHFKWLEADLFRVSNRVTIAMGYTNNLITLLEGSIKNINASFYTGCLPTFTVEGTDSAYDFLTTPSDTEIFREKRDSDIVQKIADRAQLTSEVDQTSPLTTVKAKQGGKSYLEFLGRLAAENDYELFLAGRKLHFKKDKYKDSVTTLRWGKDLIRFEPQLNTSTSVTQVIVRGWDASGKKQIEGRATAGDEDTHESEKRTASEITRTLFGDVIKVITDRPVRSVDEAQRIARSELNLASNNLIQATLETVGIPELTPATCVDIRGFGTLFSGKYYVSKVTHTLSSEGYRTTLTVRRNAA